MAEDDTARIEARITLARTEIRETLDSIAYRTDLRARLPEYGLHLVQRVGSAAIKRLANETTRFLDVSFALLRGIASLFRR